MKTSTLSRLVLP
jgi:hypothetical protein